MLDETDVIAYFDAGVADRPLVPDGGTLRGWGKRIKYELAAAFVATAGGPVLDLGCNIGHVAGFAARAGIGARVTGIDLSWPALRRAFEATAATADYVAAGGAALPFAAASFNGVVCLDVLEHVVSPRRVLAEIARVLRPGGRLLLLAPNPECIGSYGSYRFAQWRQARRGRPVDDKDRFIRRAQLEAWVRSLDLTAEPAPAYLLPRPFLAGGGWVLTPPLPPRAGWYWQQLWRRLLGLHGERLPLAWQARLCHSIQLVAAKECLD